MGRRKARTMIVIALGGALGGSLVTLLGIWLWLGAVYTGEMTLVGQASYRVGVPARPDASGRVYMLGYEGRYLLVLTSKSAERREGYYIDLSRRRIGVPNFDIYRRVPFLACAFVNADIHDGFPLDGALVAEWQMIDGSTQVRIRITGMVQQVPGDSEETLKEFMPIAYGSEIVLTRSQE